MIKAMKILISGSSGLVGSALVFNLVADGHQVFRLVRSQNEDGIVWNPRQPIQDKNALEGFDAVVHLAGENISSGRWTEARKERIRLSRTEGTRHLAEALASLSSPPKVFLCASGSNYYGDREGELLTEDSEAGKGFLASVCKEWEASAQPAVEKGIRTLHLRSGIVLSPRGGALKKMLPPFRFGVGGKVGSGKQYWSWIDLDDVIGVIEFCLNQQSLQGAINNSSPEPVTAEEFADILAQVLHRPSFFPVPAFAARLAFGEMANELLLSSVRMKPAKLISARYNFAYPDLASSLRHLLT
jgi:uncharacterized protein (TIGR01777 family)